MSIAVNRQSTSTHVQSLNFYSIMPSLFSRKDSKSSDKTLGNTKDKSAWAEVSSVSSSSQSQDNSKVANQWKGYSDKDIERSQSSAKILAGGRLLTLY